MRKRLRKKLRLKEFQRLGFEVTCVPPKVDDMELLDSFIDFIVARGLCMGGSMDDMYIIKDKGSATDKDRFAVGSWMLDHGCERIRIGSLEDVNYPGL